MMKNRMTKKLGRTGLDVGVIGFGGEWLNGLSEETVCQIMDVALENGVNYLDVFMPQKEVRTNIGTALKGRRNQMLIQGHLCTVLEDGQYERSRDLARTKASFEDLLTRLQTDYIDVGMIHYVDSDEDLEAVFSAGIMDYAQELKQQGKVRFIGLSSHNAAVALKAIETGLIDVLMFSINPAYDLEQGDMDIYEAMEFKGLTAQDWHIDPVRQKLYATCENLGVGITVMKALGAGSLLKAESSPFGQALTVTQCVQYCLNRPGVASVLIGCQTAQELLVALEYYTATQAEKDYSQILTANRKIKMTGRCMYCNHCQPCPSHIDIATVTKLLDLALMQGEVPETVQAHYLSLAHTAQDCTQCGNCEPNCPFGVAIRKNMEKAQEIFYAKR